MIFTVDIEYPESVVHCLRRGASFSTVLDERIRNLAEQIADQMPRPKPPEPTGLGAVVADGPVRWVRSRDGEKPWQTVGGSRTSWDAFPSRIRILSNGVES